MPTLLLLAPGFENLFTPCDSAQESDLAPFFGDLNPSERLSEIEPPLSQCTALHAPWHLLNSSS